jgi:hypothetical protein
MESVMTNEDDARPPAAAHRDVPPATRKASKAAAQVRDEVAGWPGVTIHEHRFGGIELRFGRKELGHLHESIADLPFPRGVRDELVATGLARPHHIHADSGWVTAPMQTAADVRAVIELFRRSYDRATSTGR